MSDTMSATSAQRPDLISRLIIRRAHGGFPPDLDLAALRRRVDRPPAPRAYLRLGLHAVTDTEIGGATVMLPARVYRRRRARGHVLFFHGGGFVLGGLDSHEDVCCRIARASRATVVSVAYRLAPEFPFPAAPEDCYAAYLWLRARLPDDAPVVLCGDSAGANLATVVAMMARDRGAPAPRLQVLYYPPTMGREPVPSATEFADGHMLTAAMIEWFRIRYVPDAGETHSPYYAPALAPDLARLPPALIVTAGMDPLRDEGAIYARRLLEAGVTVRYGCVGGVLHGFLNFAMMSPRARRVLRDTAHLMRAALAG